jgi:membrane protein DedA with SNARE-associated domain/rhodanese-related sulfurtransferase
MNETIEFLLKHGYAILFVAVLAEQTGLPIPSAPFLVAAGALAGLGRLSLFEALTLAVAASLIGDSLWFHLGKRRGSSILRFLCKIALEPDSCVRQTGCIYSRYGAGSLLFAKFVPGLSTVAPPMAGMYKLAPWKFILLDAAGAALWAGAYAAVGWWFRMQLEVLAVYLERFGSGLGLAVALALALYLALKYIQRRRIYRALRIARITPYELKERMDSGETLSIVDLRNAFERREGRIPGSLQISPLQLTGEEVDSAIAALSHNEIILYCTCPNEVTSARVALQLKRQGVERVRPLEGGFPLWRELGFPIEDAASEPAEKSARSAA